MWLWHEHGQLLSNNEQFRGFLGSCSIYIEICFKIRNEFVLHDTKQRQPGDDCSLLASYVKLLCFIFGGKRLLST